MSSHYEPFLLTSEKLVLELEKKLSSSLKNLYAGWISDSNMPSFKVTRKNQSISLSRPAWKAYGNSEKLWVGFQNDEAVTHSVLKEMFELDEYTNIKPTELTASVYDDFIHSNVQMLFDLADEVAQQNDHLEQVLSSFGSGAVVGNISFGHALLPIALSGHMVLRICNVKHPMTNVSHESLPKLTQREKILGNLVSGLEVVAGDVSISFDEFARMEVGDVVMLNSRVDQPLKSRFSNGAEANVQLCRVKDNTAIQFIE